MFYGTHRMSGTAEYRAWADMKSRCYWTKAKAFKSYGGRGITVCDEWRTDFPAFLEHIGPRPGSGYSLDRIDVNGNYEPGNVRWATRSEQASNMRRTKLLEFNGLRMTVTHWARHIGIDKRTLEFRLRAGWTVERALTAPIDTRCHTDRTIHSARLPQARADGCTTQPAASVAPVTDAALSLGASLSAPNSPAVEARYK
jgi:hypothetical protein